MPSLVMDIHVRRALTKWGNGWGLRLTKKEVERLGAKPGEPVEADFKAQPPRNWVDQLPSWSLGGDYDIDALYEEDLMEDLRRGRR